MGRARHPLGDGPGPRSFRDSANRATGTRARRTSTCCRLRPCSRCCTPRMRLSRPRSSPYSEHWPGWWTRRRNGSAAAAGCTTSAPGRPGGSRCSTPPNWCPRSACRRAVVTAHLAGGDAAMERAVEGAEDDDAGGTADAGRRHLPRRRCHRADSAPAAGRRTSPERLSPRRGGARSPRWSPAIPVSPSWLARPGRHRGGHRSRGDRRSTRLKATTALKLVLNGFSTALMVRLGKDVLQPDGGGQPNQRQAAGTTGAHLCARPRALDEITAEAALAPQVKANLRTALVALLAGVGAERALQALDAAGGIVRGRAHRARCRAAGALGRDARQPTPGLDIRRRRAAVTDPGPGHAPQTRRRSRS